MGDIAWFSRNLRGYDSNSAGEGYPIRVLSTSIHDSQIYRAQLEAIRRARDYIYIQNAYFSDDNVLYELVRARRRGVDVRVIMASSGDSGTMNLSNEVTINRMLRNGIRVYSYPGMTHVKAAVFDGWACLGSANFDKLSLQVNKEINLGTSHPEAVQQLLERVFIPDFAASNELHDSIPVGWSHRVAEFISDEML
jgi:cardiolipin synthase